MMPGATRSPSPVPDETAYAPGRAAYPWLALFGTLLAAGLALLQPAVHTSQAVLVSWSGLTLLASVLLGNATPSKRRLLAPLGVAAQTGASVLLLLIALTRAQGDVDIGLLLRLALACAMLAWLLSALIRLFGGRASRHAGASWIVLVSLLLGLAPLWGGALLDLAAASGPGADLLIGMSPLTYLAQAAAWDYLRFDWFYRATPLGALRFEYPDFWASTGLLGLLAVAVQGFDTLHRRRHATGRWSAISTSAT